MTTHDAQPSQSWALLTDLYELTMAQGYWVEGIAERDAVFHLYARDAPYGGKALVVAGLDTAIDWLNAFAFDASDIAYLRTVPSADGTPLFRKDFVDWLAEQRFSCTIDAIPEGEVILPPTPMLRVRGPLWQAQVIESALLAIVNFQSLIATSAARTVRAAQGGEVMEFGLRRAQGVDGAMSATRAAYVGGVHGTSNVLAGKRWGIPVKGTHAHSWVVAFGDEQAAFRAYANALPDPTILLVDTWDTLEGVKNAIVVGLEMKEQGRTLAGIRLDSGDLSALAKQARRLLDDAGLETTRIVASNDLDEPTVRALLADGAPISVWGIGTRLVTGGRESALGGVYKLSALADAHGSMRHVAKRSEERKKASYPGVLQTWRATDGARTVDVIADTLLVDWPSGGVTGLDGVADHVGTGTAAPLMVPVFRDGQCVYARESVHASRARCLAAWARLDDGASTHDVALDTATWALREHLLAQGNRPARKG